MRKPKFSITIENKRYCQDITWKVDGVVGIAIS